STPATRALTKFLSSPSVVHANTRSCNPCATSSRRSATAPTAQSHTHTSAAQPTLDEPISRDKPSACAAPSVDACKAFHAVSRSPAIACTLYASASVRNIDKLVPPPTSVATLTGTAAASAARQPNSPLPRNRFDDGLCAICPPASRNAARSSSPSQIPSAT